MKDALAQYRDLLSVLPTGAKRFVNIYSIGIGSPSSMPPRSGCWPWWWVPFPKAIPSFSRKLGSWTTVGSSWSSGRSAS